MDKELTKVFSDANFINKQELDAPNPPSVSQTGNSYCGVNTVERSKKDNKSLLYYKIEPPKELPLVFLDAQDSEHSDSEPSSKDSRKTLNTPTASEQIPYTAPSQVEHTNKFSAIGNPSVLSVKYTCKNALIECLQHGEKLSINKLIKAMKKAHSNCSLQPHYITRLLSKHKIFGSIMIYHDYYKKDIKHWYMTETAMKDMKISIESSSTTQDLSFSKANSKPFYKEEIIECLQNKKSMTANELLEAISKKKQCTINKYSIQNTLIRNKIFKRVESCINNSNRKTVFWSIRKRKNTPISDPVTNFEEKTYKEIVLHFLRNGKTMTSRQIRERYFKECPQTIKLPASWKRNLRNMLSAKNTCFERVPDRHGIMKQCAPWRIKKDTNKYRESAIMAKAEKFVSENTTPAIIQDCVPLTSSLGVEPKDDREYMQSILDQALDMQEDTQHRALLSGQATLNAEQILALQPPEPPPVQFCSGIGFPLISQEYEVAIELEDL